MNSSSSSHKNTSPILFSFDLLAIILMVGTIVGGFSYLTNRTTETTTKSANVLGDEDEHEETTEATEKPEPTKSPEPTEKSEQENDDEDDVKEDYEREKSENETMDDDNETTETITNSDGSITVIRRKTEDDGKVKITSITTDSTGNQVKEVTETKDNGEQEVSIEGKTSDGSEYQYKKEDGGSIKLEIKEKKGDTDSRIKYDREKDEFEVEVNNNSTEKLKIKFMNSKFTLSHSDVDITTEFPITIDEETGAVSVATNGGSVILIQMPDMISKKAVDDNDLDEIKSINLDEDAEDKLNYVVEGVKSEKLLGLFSIQIPIVLSYDPTSGSLLNTDKSFFLNLIDIISF